MERITFMWDSEQAKSVHKHWRHVEGVVVVVVEIHSFLTSAMDEDQWSASLSSSDALFAAGWGGGTPRLHWLGDWVGSRNGPDVLEKKHITFRYRDSNKDSSVCF